MSHTEMEDDDIAPGETNRDEYQATDGRRGGGRGEFIWFVTTKGEDFIFPVADIRKMEPPVDNDDGIAYIHFSGASVQLKGANLKRILHRIALQRCSAVYEYRQGQKRPAKGEPLVEQIRFLDSTKPKPKDGKLS